jgi:hypothetical protein
VAEVDTSLKNEVLWNMYSFSSAQFGTQTLAEAIWSYQSDPDESAANPYYSLHTLRDDETLARFASGVKRVTLPDDYNPISLLRRIVDDPKTGYGATAIDTLIGEYETRRQLKTAATLIERAIREYGEGSNKDRVHRLNQIRGNWARFGSCETQPAGKGATLGLRYRNATNIEFEAHEINIERLITDIKTYIRSKPNRIEHERISISNIGYLLVHEDETKYVGKKAANWSMELTPGEQHWDQVATVTTPLSKAGAYLFKGKVKDGNTTWIVVWVAYTVMVRKSLNGRQSMLFVADAIDGGPIAKANVEFFGFKHVYTNKGNDFDTVVENFSEFSNEEGLVIAPSPEEKNDFQWLIVARGAEGRLAYLGFSQYWHYGNYEQAYNQTKVFTMTDRPVYRPGQQMKFKTWIGQAGYGREPKSAFANQEFDVEIRNPKQEVVASFHLKADQFGGIASEYELPDDATLGVYNLTVKNLGGSSFRVEEYKKPEFEVSVEAPVDPIRLGEKTTATVKAKYYFGAPVKEGSVKYRVLRSSRSAQWYPKMRWDWMYGPGYWWFAYDYDWYPGWSNWGCRSPYPWWYGVNSEPPEVIAEGTSPLSAEGTFTIDIDTAAALASHGDADHDYKITAEVTDMSRLSRGLEPRSTRSARWPGATVPTLPSRPNSSAT